MCGRYHKGDQLKATVMNILSDKMLIEAFYQAKELKLDKDFIRLIEDELRKRSIMVDK
ncbi:sporulation histidine kinase inhibitor Sda [Virgibacillus siamensis]|uniref:sporulation histidine kinase inhibitor Sda n=1 Tax=Virgibacillus siamensis TaxID=480071 RepID=UPI003D160CDB